MKLSVQNAVGWTNTLKNNKADNHVNIFFLDALLIVTQGIAGIEKQDFVQRKPDG
ncbi:MAG: hypothetical protein V8T01_03250 [Oscillospiraceae bacterium]